MSSALYDKLLQWSDTHQRGVAKIDGVTVFLHRPPVLMGRAVEFIDAAPGVYPPEVRFPGEAKRELWSTELAALDGLLYALTQGSER